MTQPLLIVDDQPEIRELIRLTLGDLDVEILETDDGPAALQLVDEHAPGLVLLDVNLPGDLDGFEICRRLKQSTAGPRVILITTRAQLEDRARGSEARADHYLTKPFSPGELKQLVSLLLACSG